MTDPPERSRRLTRKQFDEVVRRASELALEAGESVDGGELSEAELFRIAEEVGLSEAHVRRALAEVRTARPPEPEGWIDQIWGPETVRVGRVVPGTPEGVSGELDGYMVGGQLLQRVRRTPHFLQYRPAVDWMSQVARVASGTARRYYIASAREVELHLEPVDAARVHLEIRVDPGIRGSHVGGGVGGGLAAGAAAGVGSGTLVFGAFGAPEVVALGVGSALFGLASGLVLRRSARAHRKRYAEVRAELEGVLDRLAVGDSLSPPPPSWRRWIERRFHGARRLGDPETGAED